MNESDGDSIEDKSGFAPKNGLFCFLDTARECGADCMAFTVAPCESPVLEAQQKNCLLLISAERLGRYVGNLTGAVIKMQQKSATESADRVRLGQTLPLDPRGQKK